MPGERQLLLDADAFLRPQKRRKKSVKGTGKECLPPQTTPRPGMKMGLERQRPTGPWGGLRSGHASCVASGLMLAFLMTTTLAAG